MAISQSQLDTLKHNLNTQDNCITADPLFCVERLERIYGIDPEYSTDGYIWVNQVDSEHHFDTDIELLEHLVDEGYSISNIRDAVVGMEDIDNEIDAGDETFKRVYYLERWEFVTAHFTRAAAEHHIAINGHNLGKSRVYVTSQFRCPEWNAVREALMNGQLVLAGDSEKEAA